jgi:fructose-1,6-bisphosphatase/inositol monophosphatase family enzyme
MDCCDYPPLLREAGLSPEILARIDHLMVGCGGFVKELVSYTAGASTVKDSSGQRLSAADELVDGLLRDHLMVLVPHSSGFSEESGAFGGRTPGLRVRWLLDPVDGTRPATLGGAFGVCAGGLILDEDTPVAMIGWVYVPTLSALYRGIVAPSFTECLLNGAPTQAETGLTAGDLRNRYIAVSSDWTSIASTGSVAWPLKLSAPGATAVHLTQLVHPGSDVIAAALTRYRAYDAAAGLAVAAAGGCAVYPLDGAGGLSQVPVDPLSFLQEADRQPDQFAPRVLVSTPDLRGVLAANEEKV